MLRTNRLIIEEDSITMVGWIYGYMLGDITHSLQVDIWLLLTGSMSLDIKHVFHMVNTMADWWVFFIAEHFGDVLWTRGAIELSRVKQLKARVQFNSKYLGLKLGSRSIELNILSSGLMKNR